jgi:hypothetical protein
MRKRLKQLAIGGAALVALALGSSAIASAATASTGLSSTTATPQASGAVPTPRFTPADAPARAAHDNVERTPIRDLRGTDHERYVRHHQRLASLPP